MFSLFKRSVPSPVDIFIVGSQKAGTSSLHFYLSQIRELVAESYEKEINYFSFDAKYKRGEKYYQSYFRKKDYLKSKVDASPEYLYMPFVAKRIYDYNPNAIIICLVRDPVLRAYSAWKMYSKFSNVLKKTVGEIIKDANLDFKNALLDYMNNPMYQNITFEKAIDIELEFIEKDDKRIEPSFIKRGFYAQYISEYYRYFDKSKVLVFEERELQSSPEKVISEIIELLGKNSNDYGLQSIDFTKKHVGNYDVKFSEDVLSKLNQVFRPHNEKLFELLGKRFDHWYS